MFYFVAILISAAVFASFLVLTALERKSGKRIFGGARKALDARVSRIIFLLNHIDFGGFIVHVARVIGGHIMHDVVSVVLRGVRSFDRFLSSMVRRLQKPRDERVSLESGSKYVKTMSYFKKNLQNPHAPKAADTPPSEEPKEGISTVG